MCLKPVKIRVDETGFDEQDFIFVGCGKCVQCRASKAYSWQFRIGEEALTSRSKYFITLTYDNEHLPTDYSLHKEDLQKFFKRLRRNLERKYENTIIHFRKEDKVRYFACGEYGDKLGRPHFHCILLFPHLDFLPAEIYNLIRSSWNLGSFVIGTVTTDSISYVTKYMVKQWQKDWREPPFQTMSRRPFLGYTFMTRDRAIFFNTVDGPVLYRNLKDRDQHLPRIYKNKMLFLETKEQKFEEFKKMSLEKFYSECERLNSLSPAQVYDEKHFEYLMNNKKERDSIKRKNA